MNLKLSSGNQEYWLLRICLILTLMGAICFVLITRFYFLPKNILSMYCLLVLDIGINTFYLWKVTDKNYKLFAVCFILTQLIIDSYALSLHPQQYVIMTGWLIFTFIIIFNIAVINWPVLLYMDILIFMWIVGTIFIPFARFQEAVRVIGIEPSHAVTVAIAYYSLIIAFGTYLIEIKRKSERQLQEMNATLNRRVEEKVEEIRKADRAVLQSQEQLAQILRHIPVGVVIIDEFMNIIYSNGVHFKIKLENGLVEEAPGGLIPLKILIEQFVKLRAPQLLENAEDMLGQRLEIKIDAETTKIIRFVYVHVRLPGDGQDIRRLVLFTEDITQEEAIRDQLIQTNHLAGMGKMAASLVHEVNNPLTGIKLNLELLQTGLAKPEMREKIFKTLAEGIDRIDRIVKSFLAFARQEKPQKRRVDVRKVIEETLALTVNFKQYHRIHIETCYSDFMSEIMADPYRLEQVFVNLLNNACDAMREKGGHLKICCEQEETYLNIIFEDDGIGIKQEDRAHIFEPFFTTKDRGYGTGLGLSTSYGIIQEHGGTIEVKSRVGIGTVFKIRLPIGTER